MIESLVITVCTVQYLFASVHKMHSRYYCANFLAQFMFLQFDITCFAFVQSFTSFHDRSLLQLLKPLIAFKPLWDWIGYFISYFLYYFLQLSSRTPDKGSAPPRPPYKSAPPVSRLFFNRSYEEDYVPRTVSFRSLESNACILLKTSKFYTMQYS